MTQERERDFEVDVEVRTVEKRRVRAASSAEAFLKMNQEGLKAINATELPPQDIEQAWMVIEELQGQLTASRQAKDLLERGHSKMRRQVIRMESATKLNFAKAFLLIILGLLGVGLIFVATSKPQFFFPCLLGAGALPFIGAMIMSSSIGASIEPDLRDAE